MEGGVPFEVALEKRLSIMRPSSHDFESFHKEEKLELSPGVAELIDQLHSKGKHVYLVSGGFENVCMPRVLLDTCY